MKSMQVNPVECPECGARLPPSGLCQDNFYNLLILESEVPGAPGELAHFYAVASYGLQHPESMGYTVDAVEGLRTAVSDVLDGRATLEDVRRRTRVNVKAAGRVTRRGDDRVPHWAVESWSTTVTDVLAGGVEGYGNRVRDWALSIVDAVNGLHV